MKRKTETTILAIEGQVGRTGIAWSREAINAMADSRGSTVEIDGKLAWVVEVEHDTPIPHVDPPGAEIFYMSAAPDADGRVRGIPVHGICFDEVSGGSFSGEEEECAGPWYTKNGKGPYLSGPDDQWMCEVHGADCPEVSKWADDAG